MVRFIMLYKVVLNFNFVDDQYFPVELFIMLYKVVLTFESFSENKRTIAQVFCSLCCSIWF